jgi:hypothetical protein
VVQGAGEEVTDLVPRAKLQVPQRGRRIISVHKVDGVMFGPQTVPVHPQGKFLCVRTSYGDRVELHMEEPMDPVPMATITVQGFRAGARIPDGAAYLGTVFERDVDYGHIYILAPPG